VDKNQSNRTGEPLATVVCECVCNGFQRIRVAEIGDEVLKVGDCFLMRKENGLRIIAQIISIFEDCEKSDLSVDQVTAGPELDRMTCFLVDNRQLNVVGLVRLPDDPEMIPEMSGVDRV